MIGPSPGLAKAARDLESVFFHQLLKSMRSTVRGSGLLGGGKGGALFTDLLDQGLARSSGVGLGLARLLVRRCDARGERVDVQAR